MSLLNQLFNRGVFGAKCKTSLNLAISRIKLLQNKRDLQTKNMRKESTQFLQASQEAIARIRVEHVIREQNTWSAFEILDLFCEFLLARVPIIKTQRECPTDLQEAISSVIFAASRCSDVPDLLHIKNLFATKYGKEFVTAVSELRPDSGINRTKLHREYNLEWDSSNVEAELSKRHEDLLGGSKQIGGGAGYSQTPMNQNAVESSSSNGLHPITLKNIQQEPQQPQVPKPLNLVPFPGTSENQPPVKDNNYSVPIIDAKKEMILPTSDVFEKARAAIAAAERASANARAAADLLSAKFERKSL